MLKAFYFASAFLTTPSQQYILAVGIYVELDKLTQSFRLTLFLIMNSENCKIWARFSSLGRYNSLSFRNGVMQLGPLLYEKEWNQTRPLKRHAQGNSGVDCGITSTPSSNRFLSRWPFSACVMASLPCRLGVTLSASGDVSEHVTIDN